MKSLFLTMLASALLVGVASAQTMSKPSNAVTQRSKAQVLQANSQLFAALNKGDYARYNSLIAPDAVSVRDNDAPEEARFSAEKIKAFEGFSASAALLYTKINVSSVKVQATTAVVTGTFTLREQTDSNKFRYDKRAFAYVFARQNGRYVLVFQTERVAPPAPKVRNPDAEGTLN